MNPAVGVTKILNNLQECIDIIEEINKRNNIVLPNIEEIENFTSIKKELIKILSDGTLDKMEKLIQSSSATFNKSSTDNFNHMIESYIDHHKKLIVELDSTLENTLGRIKSIRGAQRIDWFKAWDRNQVESDMFKGIVSAYASWEYPVMEIFPGTGDMLKHALSAEPLYIVDWENKLLDNVAQQFNEYYASKRLMKYQIDDYDLSSLPQNSFGFIYCINFLKFENISNLLELAKNTYNCLLPGGVYIFVYNNSNLWWSVENAVNHFFGLVDCSELEKGLTDIGFEIIENISSEELNTSYVICKKPGEINYIKNSSVLGKIIDKPEDLK